MGDAFADLFRNWRQTSEVRLREVADLWGVTVTHVSDIEHGRRNPPDPSKLRMAAKLFDREDDADELVRLAVEARGNRVELEANSPKQAEMLVTLHRRLPNLDDGAIEKIRKLLDRGKDK